MRLAVVAGLILLKHKTDLLLDRLRDIRVCPHEILAFAHSDQ